MYESKTQYSFQYFVNLITAWSVSLYSERCELENKVNAMKSKQSLLSEELAQANESVMGLKSRVHQLDAAEEAQKIAYDALVKERADEIRKLE